MDESKTNMLCVNPRSDTSLTSWWTLISCPTARTEGNSKKLKLKAKNRPKNTQIRYSDTAQMKSVRWYFLIQRANTSWFCVLETLLTRDGSRCVIAELWQL